MSRRLAKLEPRIRPGDKTDHDVIRENHRFLWEGETVDSWEKELAKKYYDKLFKEYCIADFSRYRENKVAMRWRIEKEVVVGKGQFICGSRACEEQDTLRSWEVNFAYLEHGAKKNALVKLRLCPKCSNKLNYHSKKREIKRLKKRERSQKKSRRSGDTEVEEDVTAGKQQDQSKDDAQEIDQAISQPPESTNELDLPSGSSTSAENLWSKGPEIEDKTREEEFDEYLEDLLL
ncbi:hypothetical protein quinque_013536 [Culex quinquefasciatus]